MEMVKALTDIRQRLPGTCPLAIFLKIHSISYILIYIEYSYILSYILPKNVETADSSGFPITETLAYLFASCQQSRSLPKKRKK